MKEKLKQFLPQIVVGGAVVLAFIFAIVLNGVTLDMTVEGYSISSSVKLLGVMFGSSTMNASTTISGVTADVSMDFTGAMSIFGLISFILLMLGLVLTVASIFVKDKKLDLFGAICVLVAGICVFLLLVAGTDGTAGVEGSMITETFSEFYEGCKLGVGVYVYGILTILAGAFGIFAFIKNK